MALYMFIAKRYLDCILFMVSMDNQRMVKQGKPQKKHWNKICYVVKITSSLYCVIKMTNIVQKEDSKFVYDVANFCCIIIRHIEVMGITISLSFDFVMITFDMREL